MDKDAMGKSFNKNTVGVTAGVLAMVVLLGMCEAYPAYREAELFDLGYERYLSSQPEKAVEAFTLFLNEFPRSSAKDAVMFWMAKGLIQLGRTQEAGSILDRMTREFPESPLRAHAIREMEKLSEPGAARESEPVAEVSYKGEKGPTRKPGEQEESARLAEDGAAGTREEGHTAKSAAREEKGTVEATPGGVHPAWEGRVMEAERSEKSSVSPGHVTAYTVQVGGLMSEGAAKRLRKKLREQGFNAAFKKANSREGTRVRVLVGEFRTRREADLFAVKIGKRTGLDAVSVEGEPEERTNRVPLSEKKDPMGVNTERMTSGQALILQKDDPGKSEARERVVAEKDTAVAIFIEGTQYTAQQVMTFMDNSLTATKKMGIKEIPWRTGNVYEDFMNEQVLYDEAKRSGLMGGAEELEEVREKYGLSPEETDFLLRYLAVSRLVDKKLKERPAVRVVESMMVRYTEADRPEKELLASELRIHAKKGKSFSEIQELYPHEVSYAVTGFEALQEWIKEEIGLLENGEISVVWSKGGYMILKPALHKLSFKPFEDMDPGESNAVKVLVKEYSEELRRERGETGIVRADRGQP